MRKLLILNCTLAKAGIERLNNLFTSIFEKYDIDFEIYHLTGTIENYDEFYRCHFNFIRNYIPSLSQVFNKL